MLKLMDQETAAPTPFYAVVDVGSNNVRMDIYDIGTHGRLIKINITEQTVFPCKLAQDMDIEKPRIRRHNLSQAVTAMRAFDAILTKYAINPENICAIMTAAVRAVENTKQGKKDIKKLVSAFGGRDSLIASEVEEALLVAEAVKLACPEKWKKKRGKKHALAFAAIGGGSIELGIINADGNITDAAALPLGIHALIAQSKGKVPCAGRLIERALHHAYPHHKQHTLCVIGGNWRALGEALCESIPGSLEGRDIRRKLVSATHRPKKYYEKLGGRPAVRAKYMPMAAAILRRVSNHFEAQRIIFLNKTIRDAMAETLHARNQAQPIPRGLERLFCPSVP